MSECCADKYIDYIYYKFIDAMQNITHYDGHREWLLEMKKELLETPEHKSYNKDFEWHTEEHTIWMILVGMFGDWGTSIRGGWIEDKKGCADFISLICEDKENK